MALKKCWLLFSIFIAGCAVNTQMVELTGEDRFTAKALFRETVSLQKTCSPWVDADANVSIDSTFSSGTIGGYLQAMAPAYLKFVGTNPFGQPLIAFTSDGEGFQYLTFSEKRYYEGKAKAKSISRFLPPGFGLEDSFYWFIGRIGPGELSIIEVGGDKKNRGYWVELADKEDDKRSRILFDPDRRIILDHTLLDTIGGVAMKAEYSDYGNGDCPLPGSIAISGEEYPGRIMLHLSDWRGDTPFPPEDFKLSIPSDFKRVTIE